MKRKEDISIVGDHINFRGLVYGPVNEQGVVFLFSRIIEDLNMYIEEIKTGFPDCIGRRFMGKGWERIRIEFEFQSKNFLLHGHNKDYCDMIVCWEDNWEDSPIEVLELKGYIEELENFDIERPEQRKSSVEKEYEHDLTQKQQDILNQIEKFVKTLNEDSWTKTVRQGFNIYSPRRVCIYMAIRKDGFILYLKTGNIDNDRVSIYREDKDKDWTVTPVISSIEELKDYFDLIKLSYENVSK